VAAVFRLHQRRRPFAAFERSATTIRNSSNAYGASAPPIIRTKLTIVAKLVALMAKASTMSVFRSDWKSH
jgi:hypothetical protein